MKWTLTCSECEQYLSLKTADKVPDCCPHCGAIFEKSVDERISENDGSTFLPAYEKYLKKIEDKL